MKAPIRFSSCAQGVVSLKNAIPTWTARKSTPASPITVVDCFTGCNHATDAVGARPNGYGNMKLVNAWFIPLKNAIIAASGTAGTTIAAGGSTSPVRG